MSLIFMLDFKIKDLTLIQVEPVGPTHRVKPLDDSNAILDAR